MSRWPLESEKVWGEILTAINPNGELAYHGSFTGSLVDPDGNRRHFINGAYGREGDLPSVEWADGGECWYVENPKRGGFSQPLHILHRETGPAQIKANGDRYWWVMGKLHRADGPAIELADGTRKHYLSGTLQPSCAREGSAD